MTDSWDDYAAGWDTNEAVIAYADNAYRALNNRGDPAGCRTLDFGCGTGLLTERLSVSASAIVALDPSAKMISVLDNKHLQNVTTIAAELDAAMVDEHPALSPGFDLIVASSALAFVPDYAQTLGLLEQLLNTGGCLVQWDWLKEEGDDGAGFSQHQIQSALTEAGLVECTTSVPFSLEGMDVVMGVGKKAGHSA